MQITEEQKNIILRVIDHGAWKHSWHLKLDKHRHGIDYRDLENIAKIKDVCSDELYITVIYLGQIQEAIDVIEMIEKDTLENMAEDYDTDLHWRVEEWFFPEKIEI